jgi:flagella basal body P-ring formation protein FlgA
MTPQTTSLIVRITLSIIGVLAQAGAASGAVVAITPEDAIERAILERMGGNISVLVRILRSDVTSEPVLRAVPDPAGRAGHPVRFVLTSGGVRKGTALATIDLQARYARAARAIERDATITAADIEPGEGPLADVPFRRLPEVSELVGLQARRAIRAGEPMTTAVVTVSPLVLTGDEVSATVRVGRVEVQTRTIASGSGHAGDVIHVFAPGSRKPLKARITGPGVVEVLP